MLPQRKSQHIEIALKEDVRSRRLSGLERYRFRHQALPELNLKEVDLNGSFLGKAFRAPLLISAMTGGTPEAALINQRLAQTAQACGIAMGLGSQRAMLEHPELAYTYQVRRFAPDILLMANIGAVQLNRGVSLDDCRRLVEGVEADALCLHLNALQEALQPEGESNFAGLLARVEALCRALPVPVVIKEVGSGISWQTASRLISAGVSAIDVAGTGGTSWALVEMHRQSLPTERELAAAFASWGLPTAECLVEIRQAAPELSLIASGGLRDGIDAAKCLALGADLAGLSTPFLKGAVGSEEDCLRVATQLIETLRICAFLCGAGNLQALRNKENLQEVPA